MKNSITASLLTTCSNFHACKVPIISLFNILRDVSMLLVTCSRYLSYICSSCERYVQLEMIKSIEYRQLIFYINLNTVHRWRTARHHQLFQHLSPASYWSFRFSVQRGNSDQQGEIVFQVTNEKVSIVIISERLERVCIVHPSWLFPDAQVDYFIALNRCRLVIQRN